MTERAHLPRSRRGALLGAALVVVSVAAACTGGGAPNPSTSVTSGVAHSTGPATSTPGAASTGPATSASPTTKAGAACIDAQFERLTPEQRAGQLVMAAINAGWSAADMRGPIQENHVGNVLYLGGWKSGPADVRSTSGLMQDLATDDATGGVGLLVGADQEGGIVQQLKDGFTTIPAATTQARWEPAELTRQATAWGQELKNAGINLNLAPVTDTVPAELGRGNGPIGRWGREYGNDPQAVTRGSVAFLKGMEAAGIGTSIKHFPGIGRLRGNTDHTAEGLDDPVMTTDDPYLQPFVAGIRAGASTVMVSSATYPKIDAKDPAMFSSAIIDGLLRKQLGYTGVVITDDVNAVAVRGVPVPERATRFVAAGGDIVLTGDTPSAGRLVEALRTKADTDPAFAAKVEASVKRVLALKRDLGILVCE